LRYSPRHDSLFEKVKSEIAPNQPGFRTLCPTRWTVKAASLESVINNNIVLQQVWEEAKDIATDSESRSRINCVQAQMERFEYLFGLWLGERVLKSTDNLSKTLQSPSLSAAEGQQIAEMTHTRHRKIFELMSVLMLFGKECFKYSWNLIYRSLFCLGGGRLHVDSRLELEIVPSLILPRNSFVSIYFKVLDLIVGNKSPTLQEVTDYFKSLSPAARGSMSKYALC